MDDSTVNWKKVAEDCSKNVTEASDGAAELLYIESQDKQQEAEFFKWCGIFERYPEVYSGEQNDLAVVPKELLPKLAEKYDFVKRYMDRTPINNFEADEDGNIKPTKETIKYRIDNMVSLDDIDKEEELKLLSKISGVKITILRKQLESSIKRMKNTIPNEKEEIEDINEISRIVDDENQIIVEQVYDEKNGCRFCVYNHNDKSIKYEKNYTHNGVKYFPIVGEELIKKAVLLPSEAIDYIDNITLDKEIYSYANKWLDAPQEVMKFGLWNVKVSYVYENFHTLNYLRVQGDTGTGKTRYLDVWGHIHYKPIMTTGTTTPAPLFRIIDKWRGTVVMDEADLRKSDESEQIIKILNNGFERGKFIMRCGQDDATKLEFFDPFSPKILSTRRSFTDKATESRCITHISSVTERKDIALNLNRDFFNEALTLRNKLLMWRFHNYFEIDESADFDLGDVEPRVKQIVGSYISLFSTDEEQMNNFKEYINNYQQELITERQSSFDGSIVGAIHSLLSKGVVDFDSKDIIIEGEFTDRNGKQMQPRSLTSLLKSLGFKKSEPKKVNGKTKRCIPLDQSHIDKIMKRYGYEVTVVTVVTETSDKKTSTINQPKKDTLLGWGDVSENRDNRNSVTKKPVLSVKGSENVHEGTTVTTVTTVTEKDDTEFTENEYKLAGYESKEEYEEMLNGK